MCTLIEKKHLPMKNIWQVFEDTYINYIKVRKTNVDPYDNDQVERFRTQVKFLEEFLMELEGKLKELK